MSKIAFSWVDEVLERVSETDSDLQRGSYLLQVSRDFNKFSLQEKNDAFLYLLGKIMRNEQQ